MEKMHSHADNTQKGQVQPVANHPSPEQNSSEPIFRLVNNRPDAIAQRKLQAVIDNSPQVKQAAQLQAMADHHTAKAQNVIQKKENRTGLPNKLKSGIESLSGYSMDDVKVHFNSAKPAQLQAHAYAQGTSIHLGPGQEKHLPHEAWHVVQQKQGRVKPTLQMKGMVNINDDAGLEKEADVMGAKALSMGGFQPADQSFAPAQVADSRPVAQRVWNVEHIKKEKEYLDGQKTFSGETALHHIVSRDSLKKLGFALGKAMIAGVKEATEFWKVAQRAAGKDILGQTKGDPIKTLQNIPLNIEYGPANPLNDPGIGFDPNTVDEKESRTMDPVSAQLSTIDGIIQSHSSEELSGEESGPLWAKASAALATASESYEFEGLRKPNKDQWLEFEIDDKLRYFRKGLKNYLRADQGVESFSRSQIPPMEEIGTRAPTEDITLDAMLAVDELTTWAYASEANLKHFLERHTYEYFTFLDKDIKLINSFWPRGTTQAHVVAYANAALLYIQSYLMDLYEMEEELPEFLGLKNVKIPGVPLPVYVMFGISEEYDKTYQLDLRTLAPDGNADAFTAEDLKTIRAGFEEE